MIIPIFALKFKALPPPKSGKRYGMTLLYPKSILYAQSLSMEKS
jgi:hypothetical protein